MKQPPPAAAPRPARDPRAPATVDATPPPDVDAERNGRLHLRPAHPQPGRRGREGVYEKGKTGEPKKGNPGRDDEKGAARKKEKSEMEAREIYLGVHLGDDIRAATRAEGAPTHTRIRTNMRITRKKTLKRQKRK